MEKLDLTKILKDCPSGERFYSLIYGDVTFAGITQHNYYPINTNKGAFTADGRYCLNGECVLFPSKGQRDWSKWQRPFVDGDILCGNVIFDGRIVIYIFKDYQNEFKENHYVALDNGRIRGPFMCTNARKIYIDGFAGLKSIRFATEEEKQKLFDAIKANGYEWDADKKELKKIEEKFDVSTLQPFDKVMVRDEDGFTWHISLFGWIEDHDAYPFNCGDERGWAQCVPYNDETKHLIGTTQQAPSKYITWE